MGLDGEEVERLLEKLDDSAALVESVHFAGTEILVKSGGLRYRVDGLDASGDQVRGRPSLDNPRTKISRKEDIECVLADIPMVKGKFEHEIQFTFVAEKIPLVEEDEIFQGNNQV